MLPALVKADLAGQPESVRTRHQHELQQGAGWVELPTAIAQKYPNAGREWVWPWAFPATRPYRDRDTGQWRRHHLHESVLQRVVKDAAQGRDPKASQPSYPPSFVRDSPSGGGAGHPDRAGTPRPSRCGGDPDRHPRPEPWPVGRQEPHRYDLRDMKSSLVVRSALRDGIADELCCEFSRDSMSNRRRARTHVKGRPTSRWVAILVVSGAALHCDIPRAPTRYADRASARPNCSSTDTNEGSLQRTIPAAIHGRKHNGCQLPRSGKAVSRTNPGPPTADRTRFGVELPLENRPPSRDRRSLTLLTRGREASGLPA